MGKLIYAPIMSLDGYIEDAAGAFDWGAPDDEVFAFTVELERSIGTYLLGRRMYETMVFWESVSVETAPDTFVEFANIWRAAQKIVHSRTLQTVSSAQTRIERALDADDVRRLKRSSAADIAIAGAELAGQALLAGLIDECHLFVCPTVVGGGKRAFPADVAGRLELLAERRFDSGVVYLHYAVTA